MEKGFYRFLAVKTLSTKSQKSEMLFKAGEEDSRSSSQCEPSPFLQLSQKLYPLSRTKRS